MLVHYRVTPSLMLLVSFYTPGWLKPQFSRSGVRGVNCLASCLHKRVWYWVFFFSLISFSWWHKGSVWSALWWSSDVGCCSDCRLNQGSYVNKTWRVHRSSLLIKITRKTQRKRSQSTGSRSLVVENLLLATKKMLKWAQDLVSENFVTAATNS